MNSEQKPEGSQAGQTLAKIGAQKGGKARATVLSPEERSIIARNAVTARWRKAGKLKDKTEDVSGNQAKNLVIAEPIKSPQPEIPYSLFKGTLKMGNMEVECHVLNDFRRVLTQKEIVRILSGGRESGDLNRYLQSNALVNKKLEGGRDIPFLVPPTGQAIGSEATFLIDICQKYLEARDQDLLKPNQLKLAAQAEIIIRACAKTGIIALIDEATGYQEVRAKRALQLKLQAFIADELQEWVRMFPPEFWIQLARLEGVHYSPKNRPLRWGKYVMAFVYDSIDPDLGKKLREKNRNPHYLQNHHQWLRDFGKNKLIEQIAGVTAIMKLCRDMDDFKRKFKKVFSKTEMQYEWDEEFVFNND
ncbi:MAG: P63C domain-containing protein [Candidatus Omnitrophota bacterium]|jgi:hypothetical protein